MCTTLERIFPILHFMCLQLTSKGFQPGYKDSSFTYRATYRLITPEDTLRRSGQINMFDFHHLLFIDWLVSSSKSIHNPVSVQRQQLPKQRSNDVTCNNQIEYLRRLLLKLWASRFFTVELNNLEVWVTRITSGWRGMKKHIWLRKHKISNKKLRELIEFSTRFTVTNLW